MLLAYVFCARLFGLAWQWAFPAAVGMLLWPPAAWSLGQTTPLVLLGQMLAWHFRARPALAGVGVGLAAALKVVPAILLVPFLLRRRWAAAGAFAFVMGGTFALALALDPGSLRDYLTAGAEASRTTFARPDNGSPLGLAADLGPAGIVALLILIGTVLALSRSWEAWVWASVALLPIVWVYSLLPLLPVLVRLLQRRVVLPGVAAALALLLPWLAAPFGVQSTGMISGCVLLTGAALLLETLHRRTADLSLDRDQEPGRPVAPHLYRPSHARPHRPRAPGPRLRTPALEVRRREGDRDPGDLRDDGDPVPPGTQRADRQPGRAGR